MERMSFNLTSFTSYLIPSLFTVDFSLIHLNQNWLLCFKFKGGPDFFPPVKPSTVPVFPGHFPNACSLFQLLSSLTSYRLTGWMLKSIHFTYINLFSNILVALPKDQVMLFIGSHGCGCCLSPENKVRCLCWWLPQQIPDTTHFWLQENTFIVRKGKESTEADYWALLCSNVPRFYSRVPSWICGWSLQI